MKISCFDLNISNKKGTQLTASQSIPFKMNILNVNRGLTNLSNDVFVNSKNEVAYYLSLLNNASNLTNKFGRKLPTINFEMNGKNFTGEYLEYGAIKAVYEINEGGKNYVICVPSNLVDDISEWKEVFREPQNTKDIKSLGLLANDYCEIQPIKINNTVFPALKMKHYCEYDFKIFDPKNSRAGAPKLDEIINLSKIDDEHLAHVLEGVSADINTLVENDVKLYGDSFCFAMTKDDRLRLYLHDLGCVPNKDSIYSLHKMTNAEKIVNAKNLISSVSGSFFYAFDTYAGGRTLSENLKKGLNARIEIL